MINVRTIIKRKMSSPEKVKGSTFNPLQWVQDHEFVLPCEALKKLKAEGISEDAESYLKNFVLGLDQTINVQLNVLRRIVNNAPELFFSFTTMNDIYQHLRQPSKKPAKIDHAVKKEVLKRQKRHRKRIQEADNQSSDEEDEDDIHDDGIPRIQEDDDDEVEEKYKHAKFRTIQQRINNLPGRGFDMTQMPAQKYGRNFHFRTARRYYDYGINKMAQLADRGKNLIYWPSKFTASLWKALMSFQPRDNDHPEYIMLPHILSQMRWAIQNYQKIPNVKQAIATYSQKLNTITPFTEGMRFAQLFHFFRRISINFADVRYRSFVLLKNVVRDMANGVPDLTIPNLTLWPKCFNCDGKIRQFQKILHSYIPKDIEADKIDKLIEVHGMSQIEERLRFYSFKYYPTFRTKTLEAQFPRRYKPSELTLKIIEEINRFSVHEAYKKWRNVLPAFWWYGWQRRDQIIIHYEHFLNKQLFDCQRQFIAPIRKCPNCNIDAPEMKKRLTFTHYCSLYLLNFFCPTTPDYYNYKRLTKEERANLIGQKQRKQARYDYENYHDDGQHLQIFSFVTRRSEQCQIAHFGIEVQSPSQFYEATKAKAKKLKFILDQRLDDQDESVKAKILQKVKGSLTSRRFQNMDDLFAAQSLPPTSTLSPWSEAALNEDEREREREYVISDDEEKMNE